MYNQLLFNKEMYRKIYNEKGEKVDLELSQELFEELQKIKPTTGNSRKESNAESQKQPETQMQEVESTKQPEIKIEKPAPIRYDSNGRKIEINCEEKAKSQLGRYYCNL